MLLITYLEKYDESMKDKVHMKTHGLRLFRESRGSGYMSNISILHVNIIVSHLRGI